MKRITRSKLTAALGLSLALGASLLTAQVAVAQIAQRPPEAPKPGDAPKQTVSKAVVKQVTDAQKYIKDKKWDEALARITEADAVSTKTPFDAFVLAQQRAYTLSQMGRTADAIPAYIAEVESGFLPPEEVVRISRGVTQLYYQAKDFARTADFGRNVIAAGNADADTYFFVAHALYMQDKSADSAAVLTAYIADAAKKGQKPTENSLLVLTQASVKNKDSKAVLASLDLLVQNYAKPDYWHDLLTIIRDESVRAANSDVVTLNIYRLMRETGSLTDGNDILELGQLALQQGSPGEAADAMRRGQESNAFRTEADKAAARSQAQTAQKQQEADRAGLAKFEIEAKASKAGEGDVRLGQAYLSYDQPDKAVEAIQRGIAKGGLRNADEAQILLGIALLHLGRKDDASAAFTAVKGTDPRFGNLARLWVIRTRA